MYNQPSEIQITRQIMSYLAFKGYYVMRLNSGMLPMGEGRYRRMIRMLPAGTPDIMAFKVITDPDVDYVDLLFIECKRPGNKPTDRQRAAMQELEAHGARCFVATSIEDVEKQLEGR